ncbi:MAG: hypothetical protein HKN37_17980 [Rhodothermales bacterium]|nr:hypothetical protein [Rhodothermales bacterium]
MTRQISVIAVVAVVLLGIIFLPVDVPYNIAVQGRVVPAKEWSLSRSRNDAIETTVRDNERGGVTQYTVNRFAGGDAARLTIEPGLQSGSTVHEGDTVASIYSNEIARQYSELSGRLNMATASLDLYATGEKEAVVEEERVKVLQAEELSRQHQLELNRLRRLRSESLISEQELELAESEQRVLEAGVEVARARYESVSSGAKPEQIELTRTEVRSLQEEIDEITERLRLSTITSPLSGRVARSFGADTLVSIYDTTAYVVMMIVPLHRRAVVGIGDTVLVSVAGLADDVSAVVSELGDEVHIAHGQEVLLVHARISNPPRFLFPGSSARCRIQVGRVPIWEFIRQGLSVSA